MSATETNVRKDTAIKQLHNALVSMQSHVIGIATIYGYNELVIEKDDHMIKTVHIGNGLGLTTTNISIMNRNVHALHLFPDNKTLTDMLADPIAYNEWCKTNYIK